MNIIKKNGTKQKWMDGKITRAVENAMSETEQGINEDDAITVEMKVKETFKDDEEINIEQLQSMVELVLMKYHPMAAKKYIIYRNEQSKLPAKRPENKLWSTFKHQDSGMDTLGDFVFYRTYSKEDEEKGRREKWWETSARAVKYNTDLDPTMNDEQKLEVLEHVFNHKIFLSGRTLWMGGGEIGRLYPIANFNCSFTIIDRLKAYKDLFYLLMVGSGVGVRIKKDDVAKLPKLRNDLIIVHEEYTKMDPKDRLDHTSLKFLDNRIAKITIGDSKEGWVKSLEMFFDLLHSVDYRLIDEIIINYDNVRPKGEELKRFGGTASGYTPLANMFKKIYNVIQKHNTKKTKLKSIDCMDIANIIGENVVSGGVRRTAEIMLIDADDDECIQAKNDLYYQIDGQWHFNEKISHRQVSNNSIFYEEKPTRERMDWQIDQMRHNGEPAFINAEAARRRKENFEGVNPCGEILLDTQGLCNLTTLVVDKFVEDGVLNEEEALRAVAIAGMSAYRLTLLDLELPEWDETHKRDVIVGTSITGWQDMANACNMSKEYQIKFLRKLKEAVTKAVNDYADKLGHERPNLITTVKPEGTQSQMSGSSSGLHFSHSEYYIRRVRISADDALVDVCEELEYPVYPEVGQTEENCVTKVVEFPVKAPAGKTKHDVGAIEQLEIYLMFMEEYVDHNASITVHVRPDEWQDVKDWMWENWDSVIGVSFLPLDDSSYQLLPYEEITKEEYEERKSQMKPFRASLISKYDKNGQSEIDNMDGCENGVCPIR